MKKLRLASQLENRTRAFFGFKSSVRSFAFNANRINSSSFSSGLYITAERRRLQHKRASRLNSFRELFHQRPSALTSDFFITRQNDRDSSLRLELKSHERSQDLDRQRTVGFHIEYTWPVNAIAFFPPGSQFN